MSWSACMSTESPETLLGILDILLYTVVGWSSSLPFISGGPCDLVLGLLVFAVMLQVYLYTTVLLSLTFVKLRSLHYLAI